MRDLIGAYDRINRVYRMYIESAFPFRFPVLNEERRRILAQVRGPRPTARSRDGGELSQLQTDA